MGIREAFEVKVFKDKLIPGDIIPPKYFFLVTTSNVVAVPKSIIIKLFLLSITPIELANLSEPTCFLFTLISINFFKFNFFIYIVSLLKLILKKV